VIAVYLFLCIFSGRLLHVTATNKYTKFSKLQFDDVSHK